MHLLNCRSTCITRDRWICAIVSQSSFSETIHSLLTTFVIDECCSFLMIDYYLRPIITGKERPDKIHRPGRAILKVYNQLTEEDAMALTKMPSTHEAMMRWNASLKNIASMVRNHTTGNLQA